MSNQHDSTVSIRGACHQVGVSPQAYYQHQKRSKEREQVEQKVLKWVRQKRKKHPRMGARKLYQQFKPRLQVEGIKMGRDKLFNLLRDHQMLIRPRRRKGPHTTNGSATRWKNLLEQATIEHPNQGWVADISYLRTLDGFCYMALISDVYSRKILGWDVSDSLELDGALRALDMALEDLPEGDRVIHHSDRGGQYRSKVYTARLQSRQCLISMTEKDHCAENAQAERLNGILKGEYYLDVVFRDINQARKAVESAINLFNTERPHLSLDYQLPEMVYQAA